MSPRPILAERVRRSGPAPAACMAAHRMCAASLAWAVSTIAFSSACTDTAVLVGGRDGGAANRDGASSGTLDGGDGGSARDVGVGADGGSDVDAGLDFGSACTNACSAGYMCLTNIGTAGHDLPNGLCTKACQSAGDCPPATAQCGLLHGSMLCIPTCDVSSGQSCRPGYACCSGGQPVNGPGVCAPHWSALCKVNGD